MPGGVAPECLNGDSRCRRDLGGVTEAYLEVARRLGIHKAASGGGEAVH